MRNAYLQHLGVEGANSDPRRAYRRSRGAEEGCWGRISIREELNLANFGANGEIAIREELIGGWTAAGAASAGVQVSGAGVGEWRGPGAGNGVEDKRLRNAYLQHLGVEGANSDPRRAYRRSRGAEEGCWGRISIREELNLANFGANGEIAIREELICGWAEAGLRPERRVRGCR
ncbi:hypothetical protein [Alicyclobacillus sp. SO9]|uniref:hypothetical protein n=1 Tax=Alicyclobacillus sp. SO9 TaxID=2665646 RepID=UPI0018E7DFE4|nr:hypothetical protein [Alicyclobacillus sp. SO9]QQE79264.1 hypothetical protein GI364_01775 [Alicyclobacillus sp. SO9]